MEKSVLKLGLALVVVLLTAGCYISPVPYDPYPPPRPPYYCPPVYRPVVYVDPCPPPPCPPYYRGRW